MKKILRLFLVLVILVAAFFGWQQWSAQKQDAPLTLYGNVDIHQVDLAFRVGGRIRQLEFEEGQRVKKDELLALLDDAPYQDTVREAQAECAMQQAQLDKLLQGYRIEEIQQARSKMEQAEAAMKTAQLTFARVENLFKTRAVSRQNLDDSRGRYDESRAAFQAARDNWQLVSSGFRVEEVDMQKAALQAAQARLAKAQTSLDDTRLYAPDSGVMLTRVRETGAIVQGGQTVYTLTLSDPVWLRAYVNERQLGLVKPGQKVRVHVDAVPQSFPGTVGFISPTAEFTPKTVETTELRTNLVYRIRVIADDPENVMRQGMPVTITLE